MLRVQCAEELERSVKSRLHFNCWRTRQSLIANSVVVCIHLKNELMCIRHTLSRSCAVGAEEFRGQGLSFRKFSFLPRAERARR